MRPNLYSQTPGAIHMGGGFASPFSAHDAFLGNIYGTSARGDAAAQFAASMPSHLMNIGTAASMAQMFGIGGAHTARAATYLGMGGLSMGPQLLATAALQYGAGQMQRGQQQYQISSDLSRRVFGERDMGGLRGMGASREQISGFARAFREMANSSELLTNDNELKNVLNKFSDMKLLDTSRSLGEMATRVKKMTKTLREISMDLGTTLEGALPSVQRHAQMGFTDIDSMRQSIRTNRALRGVGINMSDSTIGSFEMAQASTNFAMGGDKKLGALGAQRTLRDFSVATSMGLLSDEDLMSATGKRGEDAVADLAQQSMQASSTFMQSSYGHVIASALGEVKDGKFTGGIDQDVKRRMKEMTPEEIQRLSDEKLRRGGAASFQRQMRSGMGANMASQMDMSEFSSVLDKVFDNEEVMAEVLREMTGMRGQTLDVLLQLQKDGDKITGEAKRRMQQMGIRNRLNSIVQQKFTLSGRLNTFYRNAIAEPIGRPLQQLGNDIGDSVGGYMDNFGTQILEHGLGSGIIRATFGMGQGTDLTEQSYADRTKDLRSAVEQEFGVGDEANRGVSLLDKKAQDRSLLTAAKALNESEFESVYNTNTFGANEENFLEMYKKGKRTEDIQYTGQQKRAILSGLDAAVQQGDIQDMTEVYAQTTYEFGDAFDLNKRIKSEKHGGMYGDALQMANDMSLTAGERKTAQLVVDRIDKRLSQKVTLQDEDQVRAEQAGINVDLEDFFESGTDGVETTYYGLGQGLQEFENDYLHNTLKTGQFNKLKQYMEGLSTEEGVSKLVQDGRFHRGMTDKDAVGIAKDVFGVDIDEKEGAQAKTFFLSLLDKYMADGSVSKFASNMNEGAQGAVAMLDKKMSLDSSMRKLGLVREIQESEGLNKETRDSLRTTFADANAKTRTSRASQIKLFDQLTGMGTSDINKVKGEAGKAFAKIKSASEGEGSLEENLRANLKKTLGDAYSTQALEDMSVEDLKTLAVKTNIVTTTPATRGSTTGKAIGNLDPADAAKTMASFAQAVSENVDLMTASQMRFNRSVTDNVKEINHRIGR